MCWISDQKLEEHSNEWMNRNPRSLSLESLLWIKTLFHVKMQKKGRVRMTRETIITTSSNCFEESWEKHSFKGQQGQVVADEWEILCCMCVWRGRVEWTALTRRPSRSDTQNNASWLPTWPKAGATCSHSSIQNGFLPHRSLAVLQTQKSYGCSPFLTVC